MGKLERLLKREKYFIDLAKQQRLYCSKHNQYLTPFQVMDKHCYSGDHGHRPCQYILRKP